MDDSEPQKTVFESNMREDTSITNSEGNSMDYISIDVSDEEAVEIYDAINEQTTKYDSDEDLQFDDLDEMIKPIRIMERVWQHSYHLQNVALMGEESLERRELFLCKHLYDSDFSGKYSFCSLMGYKSIQFVQIGQSLTA